MKTFTNQVQENQHLTLPFKVGQEVIIRMRKNPLCFIHEINTSFIGGIIKTTIKYHYNHENIYRTRD